MYSKDPIPKPSKSMRKSRIVIKKEHEVAEGKK
jgi:hypothetical protein